MPDARLHVRPQAIAPARRLCDRHSFHAAHRHGHGDFRAAISPWLLSFSWPFFLSLALAKQHVEVARACNSNVEDVAARRYRGEDWPLTLGFGIGTGLTSIVIMLLYLTNDAMPSGFYDNPKWPYAVPTLMMMWLMRIWLLSNRMELDDDPVVFALRGVRVFHGIMTEYSRRNSNRRLSSKVADTHR